MSKKLLGSEIEPKCEYCLHAVIAADGVTVLCEKKGITDFDDSCKKFEYDPLKRTPRRQPKLPTFFDEDFKL